MARLGRICDSERIFEGRNAGQSAFVQPVYPLRL